MSPLLDALLTLLADWRQVFQQQRSFARALRLSLAQIMNASYTKKMIRAA
jgi:hypothetical protein